MVKILEDGKPIEEVQRVFEYQPDATISQANPVSNTLYTVLDTTKNVRIITAVVKIVWATTQPTPLDIVITVDGQPLLFRVNNPVSGTNYEAGFVLASDANQSEMPAQGTYSSYRAFLLEGRSVKVEVRIVWATTQPTPLVSRVKYAKIP